MSEYPFEWREVEGSLVAFARDARGREIRPAWAPQEGSQVAFLECPIFEALYEGTRGPGKTDALLMDFAQHVGKGYGRAWRGVIFRQTYDQLKDLMDKALNWFPSIFPGARWNQSDKVWTFPDGEQLLMRYMERPQDYRNYHGHAYPWIGFEELTTWADDQCYKLMMSCCRSTMPGMPRRFRATTNPYGVGHNWVKLRFGLPVPPQAIIGNVIDYQMDDPISGKKITLHRVAIHGDLSENKILLHTDPEYPARIAEAARNEAEKRAWLYGDWDVVAGGMFDDIWFEAKNRVVVPRFKVPREWRIDRSFDWGSARPFSVGWWAESNGEDLTFEDGRTISTVPGDLFRIHEWYGWSGEPNEGSKMLARDIAKGIRQREIDWGIADRVSTGVADSAIFSTEDGHSIADELGASIRLDSGETVSGLKWHPSDKGKGSRAQGWEIMRKRLAATVPQGGPREEPGLFVVGPECPHFLRTVPTIPRSDKNLDDVNTDAEDHVADEVRYRVRWERPVAKGGRVKGMT